MIIGVFFTGIMLFGIWQNRLNRSLSDYFLAGRKMPWITAMFSIVATETSVLTFISVPGLAYRQNWFFLQLALGYIFGRLLVSRFLLPQYFKTGVQSIYEVLGQRFGSGIQKTASLVFLITRVLADGVRFLATAIVVQVITGWTIPTCILLIGTVTLIYTLIGGIRTVLWIDSFQFVLYLSGAVISIIFILLHLPPDSHEMLLEMAAADRFSMLHLNFSIFTDAWSFPGAVIGGALLSFASHGTDYMMVQRVLSCRNLNDARKAMVGSGVFVFIQFALFLLTGSLIYVFLQGQTLDTDREFAWFIVHHLPAGLKGLLLAGVLSAAMSTLSSSINSLASSTVVDWLNKRTSLSASRLISLIWGVILISIALLFTDNDSVVVIIGLKIASFTYGGLLGLFILSRVNRPFHPISLSAGLIAGLLIVFLLNQIGAAWTMFIGISVLINLGVTFLCQFVLDRHAES